MTVSIFSSKNIKHIKILVNIIPDLSNKLKVNIPFHRKDWIEKIKQVPHARWDELRKHWTIPYSKVALRQFHQLFKGETQYLFPIDPNIPERYSDYFENRFPSNKVTLKEGNTTYFKVFSPKEANAWRNIIKQVPGRTWNPDEKCWQLPYVKHSFRHLKKHIGNKLSIKMTINPTIPDYYQPPTKITKNKPKPVDLLNVKQKKALIAIEEKLIIERKSWRTIKSYKTHLIGLFRYYPNTLPSQISAVQIQKYVLHKIKNDNIHERTQGQIINAFAAFYKRLLGQKDRLSLLKRPKKIKDLPNVFSKQEIERLLNSVHNIKHKAILMLVYSAGLRKSELINLRKEDILFERKCIFVKAAKGKKDRYVMLSEKAAVFIKQYLELNGPKYWLFEGQYGGQYSETSIQQVFTNTKRRATINPYVTFHGLRHSFATHLVENNVPLHIVKDLLGHQSLKTTQVYLHVSDKMRKNIQSPLDGLSI